MLYTRGAVSQDGTAQGSASYTPTCDGTARTHVLPITASQGTFHTGSAVGNASVAVIRNGEAFSGTDNFVEKRMVGGRSFMVGGHLCCGVTGPDLMVRVGPAAYRSALAEPHARPMSSPRSLA